MVIALQRIYERDKIEVLVVFYKQMTMFCPYHLLIVRQWLVMIIKLSMLWKTTNMFRRSSYCSTQNYYIMLIFKLWIITVGIRSQIYLLISINQSIFITVNIKICSMISRIYNITAKVKLKDFISGIFTEIRHTKINCVVLSHKVLSI